MRTFLLYLFLIFLFPGVGLTQKNENYFLYTSSGISQETLNDFIYLLNKGTSKEWLLKQSENSGSKGIILKLENHPSFTIKESFRAQSNGRDQLIISSSSNEGLIFGFYKHLRQLGYKFYLPDEIYSIIPSLINPIGPKKDIIERPFLQVRDFFGTGGFGTTTPDPDKSVQKSWNLWKIRNGFGSAYHLSGHRGENFIIENKEKLSKNPGWLVSPLSKNDHTDQLIKLNYQNKNAVDFFTDWSIQPFRHPNYKLPPPSHSEFVSVEPSDGGGFLNDLTENSGKKLPSVSDQVFGAANLAAQKLDKLFPNHPNIGVNLYAYSGHAAPPSFSLHPRVFVQIIPYQFQNIAYGPSFISLWSSKAKRFGLYDYFKYPDVQFDLPGGISLEESMKRLIHSVRHGSEGTTYESSFSKFSTGIPLYIMGRYMADGNENWKLNLENLIKDLYPKAETPINELFSLFYNEPAFSISHFGNAVALLQKADELVVDATAKKRVTELKQYLQFVHIVYQSRETARGRLDQRIIPVAEYAWALYESKIIHSYRIMQLVSYAFLNTDKGIPDYNYYQKLHLDWFPETKREETAWNKIPQGINTKKTETDFNELLKKYSPSASASAYSFKDVTQAMTNLYSPVMKMVIGGDQTARGYFGIFTEKPTEIKIRYILKQSKDPSVTISSLDNNYQSTQAFVLNKISGEQVIKIPAGETSIFINATNNTIYRMEVSTSGGVFFFDGAPRGIMAFYKKLEDAAETYTYAADFYPSHFFMPRKISTVSYRVQLNALSITSSAGKKITSNILSTEHGGFENRQFQVPPGETGKIWKSLISGNYNYSFKNIPDRYFLLKEK